jgi:hypothetical protein
VTVSNGPSMYTVTCKFSQRPWCRAPAFGASQAEYVLFRPSGLATQLQTASPVAARNSGKFDDTRTPAASNPCMYPDAPNLRAWVPHESQ